MTGAPWEGFDEVIDVRSPAEYAEDCIPGAVNLPALSNAERAEVGALHRRSPFAARLRGAGMVAANIAAHLRAHLAARPPGWRPLVYCKRGGQRSGAVVEVLRRVGWDAAQLAGGYKIYRIAVMDGIRALPPQIRFRALGGKTGAGKTALLRMLADGGAAALDLEKLGNHRGSAFGDVGAQPSQRRFESRLFAAMSVLPKNAPVFVEAEGRKIGRLHLPQPLLFAMRNAPVLYLDAELRERARRIAADYAAFFDPDKFESAAAAIGKYVGAKRLRLWNMHHSGGEWETLAADMLSSFYDPGYQKSLAANYAAPSAVFAVNPNRLESMQKTAALLAQTADCAAGGDKMAV
ncbi:MAG: tRNA 2-selenouridine(34) synthase MnmH [Gammaproteobacteria bacterium]